MTKYYLRKARDQNQITSLVISVIFYMEDYSLDIENIG
jgi:hypothetical protein